jgi:hypothetical protein
MIHAKHRGAPLRNGAPNDGDAEHGLTFRPGTGKLSSDARVVYEIVLRFIPRGGADRTSDATRIGSSAVTPTRRRRDIPASLQDGP